MTDRYSETFPAHLHILSILVLVPLFWVAGFAYHPTLQEALLTLDLQKKCNQSYLPKSSA